MEILELKSTITEMKNSIKGLNRRTKQAEEGIREPEGRSIEI